VRLFKLIDAEKANHPISLLCRVLKGSRSGYYDWKGHPPSKRAREDVSLTDKVREIHDKADKSKATRESVPSSGLWECVALASE
jgi:hypothetical protein